MRPQLQYWIRIPCLTSLTTWGGTSIWQPLQVRSSWISDTAIFLPLTGQGQAPKLWGPNYAKTANDNMLLVIMIETPTGTANAYDIASVPGVDVVIIGNHDLSVFSGFPQNDPRYQQLVTKIHDDTLRAGKDLRPGERHVRQGTSPQQHVLFLSERAFL